jgi:hypothetical protein
MAGDKLAIPPRHYPIIPIVEPFQSGDQAPGRAASAAELQGDAPALAVNQGQFLQGAVRGHGHDLDLLIGFVVEGRDPDMRLAAFFA